MQLGGKPKECRDKQSFFATEISLCCDTGSLCCDKECTSMYEVIGKVCRDMYNYVAIEISSGMNELGLDIISLCRDQICSKL